MNKKESGTANNTIKQCSKCVDASTTLCNVTHILKKVVPLSNYIISKYPKSDTSIKQFSKNSIQQKKIPL